MGRSAFILLALFVATASSIKCKTKRPPPPPTPPPPKCISETRHPLDKISKHRYLIQLYLEPRLEGSLFDLNLAKEKCILRMRGNETNNKPYFVLLKNGILMKTFQFPQTGSRLNLTFGRGELVVNSQGNHVNYDLNTLLKKCGMGSHGILGNLVGGVVGGIVGSLESLFGAPLFHISSKFASGVGVCIINISKI